MKKGYKVYVTSPDLRGGTRVIDGGLDKKSAKFEAKRWKDLGMITRILEVKND